MRPENGIINKIKSPCGGNVRQRLVNRKKKKNFTARGGNKNL